MKPKKYITPAEAAARMGINERTLANYRSEGHGPKWVKIKNRIMYEELTVKADLSRQKSRAFWERQQEQPIALNWKAPTKPQHHDV